jgi:hypothetical protein
MTRYINSEGSLNAYNISPNEVQDGDHYGYKLVAVIDGEFWTVFMGLTDWSDQQVAEQGESVSEEVAIALFSSLQYNRTYYQ